MDCTQSLVDVLSHAFSEIDRRIIKATVLEYGDDIESAISDLIDISDVIKETDLIDHLRVQCSSLLRLNEDIAVEHVRTELVGLPSLTDGKPSEIAAPLVPDVVVEQVRTEEKKSEVAVGLPSLTDCKPSEIAAPLEPDVSKVFNSASSVEEAGKGEKRSAEPLAVNDTGSKLLDNSIDIANVTSSMESNVQEARVDIDDVKNLIKEVGDLRAKVEQEQMAAENAELEAGRGGDKFLMEACDVRKQAQKMKEDNLKLSLEIHGEKSVLSLEYEELNVRVQQMKHQKEKAVTMLNEIRDTLQCCYDTARENRKRAEEDWQLKEEKAKKVLEQEEDSMAKIVQEAKMLKMETEACTLLREFLVSHGSIIDALQGEISNLCDDVTYLKMQVQGVQLSMNTVSADQQLGSLHSLRDFHKTVSTSAGGEMKNSSASDSTSTWTPMLDLNLPRKSQFLCSSGPGVHESMIPTEDGFASFMKNGIRYRASGVPIQEPSYIESLYGSNPAWSPTFKFSADGQKDHARADTRDFVIEPKSFGASHLCTPFCDHAAVFNRNADAQGTSHEHRAYGGDKQGEILDGYAQFPDQSTSNMWQHAFGKQGDINMKGNGDYMQGWNSSAHMAPLRNSILHHYP